MDFLFMAFAVFGVAELVRALPWPEAWKLRKPLSCHVCMVHWSAIAWFVVNRVVVPAEDLATWWASALWWAGAAGAALALEFQLNPTPPAWGATSWPGSEGPDTVDATKSLTGEQK